MQVLPPLRGVRVLDLGQYISGPVTGVLLAEMGADVIKIEPPEGDPFRKWEDGLSATFVAFNRGKRSVVLDLKSEADKQRLYELVRTVDVLIENFRPGVTKRLGIDYETLEKMNPGLIYTSITGFGSEGPLAGLPAYDGVALGYSGFAGLMLDPENPRLLGPAIADAVTGHSAGFSILAALFDRFRTQHGQLIEISMFGALVHFLHSAVSKKVVEDREEGPFSRVRGSQAYVFVTNDGRALLIHMSSPPKFWEGLCNAVSRPDLIKDPRFLKRSDRQKNYELLRTELEPIFKSGSRDKWLEALRGNEVPCAPVNSIGEALSDEQFKLLGIVDTVEEPGLGPMPRIRPPVHWGGSTLPAVARAPFLGEHTGEVFEEAKLIEKARAHDTNNDATGKGHA